MFSHDPLSGVYSGITPCANSQVTIEVLGCPARLSHQHQAEWWQWPVRDMSQPGRPVRCTRELGTVDGHLRQSSQDLEQFILQPGVQDRIPCTRDAFGTHLARGRTEQGQQLGGATAQVLVRLADRPALGLPRLTGLRNRLLRTGLILAPQPDAQRFGDALSGPSAK